MQSWIWDEEPSTGANLAAYTAHEVRNPLAALRAMAQLTLLSSDPEVRNKMMHRIVASIDELDQFLHQVLVMFQSEPVPMERIDVGSVLDGVIGLFAVQADEAGVDIELRQGTPRPVAWGNPELLRHVFINLLKNALEAMPKGGPIVIYANRCEGRGAVRVAFHDRGVGIPEEMRHRLLEDAGVTSRQAGGGFGLPFVHRVVCDVHNGKVWFRTRSGGGTIFCVEIPSAPSPQQRGDVALCCGDDGPSPTPNPEEAKSVGRAG